MRVTIESGMCGGSGALWYYSNTQWGENICSALWVFTGVFNCLPEGELQTADSWSWWKLEVSCLTIGDSEKETFGDTRTMALSAGQCRAANYPNFLNGIQRQLVTV